MTDSGSRHSLPAQYRIGLAIPFALLIHTLVFTLVRFDPATEEAEPGTIKITLSHSGHTPSPTSEPIAPAAPVTPEATLPPAVKQKEILVSKESTEQTEEPRKSAPEPIAPTQQPTPIPIPNTLATEQIAAAPDTTGNQGQTDDTEQVTQISEPAEQTPYINLLAARIVSYGTPYLNDANHETLTKVTPVEVELRLMDNGALIGASITKPSGDVNLDRAAYRGALGASPYPEPPAGNKEGNRFRVTIKFAPERI